MQEPKPKRLLRLEQVLERIPVSKSTWWRGRRSGRFPESIRMGERCTMWQESDIDAWIEKISEAGEEQQ